MQQVEFSQKNNEKEISGRAMKDSKHIIFVGIIHNTELKYLEI